jgi:8-oxo-dGTP pyrophosphatase MutT (NUDIX family)
VLIDEWPAGAGGEVRAELSAGGVVLHAGRVLVVRRGADEYRLPKGHVDPGETPTEAAVREVAEEAGVQATIVAPLGVVQNRFVGPRGRVDREVHWYLMSVPEDSIGEHEPAWTPLWVEPAEAIDLMRFEAERVPLRWADAWVTSQL